jgi:hypothetical protein
VSQFELKVDDSTLAAMSERQLRMFHAVNYMLDTLETAGIDLAQSRVYVEEESGRLVIELTHRSDDRFSFAVTMQETSRCVCVWYDRKSVTFYPDWHASPDGWIDEGLRLVWDTLRGSVEVETTRFHGEEVTQTVFRYDDDAKEHLVQRYHLSGPLRWYQRGEVERFRLGFGAGSPDSRGDGENDRDSNA